MTESALDFVVEILSEYEEKVDYPALLSQIKWRLNLRTITSIGKEMEIQPVKRSTKF